MADPGPFNTSGNHIMRLRVPPGRGGADLVKVLPKFCDKLYARWYQKWEQGYNFAAPCHGGGLHAGDRNLLGRSDFRPQGNDWFCSWIEPYNGRLHLYSYYRGMYQDCADPQGSCWGDAFPCTADEGSVYCEKSEHRDAPGKPPLQLETGRWYCIEILLEAGSAANADNQANGRQDFWIDGVEYGPFEHLWHRTTTDVKISILWLSLFHHDGTHSVQGIMLDDIVVSEEPVGPAQSRTLRPPETERRPGRFVTYRHGRFVLPDDLLQGHDNALDIFTISGKRISRPASVHNDSFHPLSPGAARAPAGMYLCRIHDGRRGETLYPVAIAKF
jgi:hypothetical protein